MLEPWALAELRKLGLMAVEYITLITRELETGHDVDVLVEELQDVLDNMQKCAQEGGA